ncbi:hypothetical protein [Paenibacillus dendritiformis]|uniref:hypothetical protein n=1 Tax=Paenibacillus dendritiformis TaxID=130049 RepID=UPI00387E0838
MKARGNTKVILQKVTEIQRLVGEAKGLHDDDQNPMGHQLAQEKLVTAFDLCVEIRDMYDPV